MYQIDYPQTGADQNRYARCIEASRRIRWDIEGDIFRGREFDFSENFLPPGVSKISDLGCLTRAETRMLSQIQGRTYANMFGLVERFINAKILEVSRDHWFGDQVALEALIRFSDEELKHQALFRRVEETIAAGMPGGYVFVPQPNDVASVVLEKSTWSVLGLTCCIELFTQSHYKGSIEGVQACSDLFKDIFLYHWKEESQHAILDELEWRREDGKISDAARDQAVNDLIALVAAVDGICQAQAEADGKYFLSRCRRSFSVEEEQAVCEMILKGYRWQFIVSGVEHPRFQEILTELVNEDQMNRIQSALGPIVG
jgi:hypothetical protein